MNSTNEELIFINKIWDILCKSKEMDVLEIENGLKRLMSHIKSSERLLQMHFFMMQIASETDLKGVGLLTLNAFRFLSNSHGCSLYIHDEKKCELKEFLTLAKKKCDDECCVSETLVEKELKKIEGMGKIIGSCDCNYDYIKTFPIYKRDGDVLGCLVGYYEGDEFELESEMSVILDIFITQMGLSLESVMLKDKMETLAYTDELTGLFNKRFLVSRLEEGILRTVQNRIQGNDYKGVGVILYDVDNFKHYNDTFGHVAGDDVLRTLGKIIREHVGDKYVGARYGGEELCVIMDNATYDEAMELAEKIRKEVDETVFEYRKVTVSGGVSHYPTVNRHKTIDLLNSADIALYNSKRTTKNTISKFVEESK